MRDQGKGKPVIGYLCSYFPYKLINGLGFETLCFNELNCESPEAERSLPVNICGYIRYCEKVLNETEVDGIVLTNCCNGMQRLYDYIKTRKPELLCYMLELPRENNRADCEFFIYSSNKMIKEMCDRFEIDYFEEIPNNVEESLFSDTGIEEGSIYVLGSAISPELRAKLEEYLEDYSLKINLCHTRSNGDELIWRYRNLNESQKQNFYLEESKISSNKPCARMSYFSDWFEKFMLKNNPKLEGLIYISSQHCDGFLFRYPFVKETCKKYNIPLLALESDYDCRGFGQVSTRLEAYKESLNLRKRKAMDLKGKDAIYTAENYNSFKQRMHLTKGIIPKLPYKSIQKVVENQVEIFTKKIWEQPEKIVWTNMVMAVEFFYSAGLVPVNMELVAGWLASLGLSRELISESEGIGLSSSLCSYHKATVGLLRKGGLPEPKGVAISSHICDGGVGVAHYFAKEYKADTFILNTPFHDNNENLQYVINQYRELISWIENYTGEAFNRKRLLESMELSNMAREYWIKAYQLRKGRPLFPGHLSLRNLFGATFLFGSELGYKVAKTYYEELLELSQKKDNTLKDKKKRILWIHFAPLYNNKIMEYFEDELDCCIVMDITGHIYWDKYDLNKPLESLAKRALSHFYLGEAHNRQELYLRLIKDYKIDGIIHFMHNGCRAIPGSSWQIRDISKKLRLPYLELSGDCIDPRGFSDQQMKLRMEAFKESLGRDLFVSRN